MKSVDLSIIIPVLNEESNLHHLIERLEELEKVLNKQDEQIEFVVNDNASEDKSSEILAKWASYKENVNLVRFASTVPFQTSILRGMKRAKGRCVVVLQSDLQDPPELIEDLFKSWKMGNLVTVTVPQNRHNNLFQDSMRKLFYRLMSAGSSDEIIVGFQDFYALDASVSTTLSSRSEKFQFIRGSLASEFGINKVIPYKRNNRFSGKSKFSFFNKYDLAMDALLVYSSTFIRLLTISGLLLAGLSFLSTVFVLITSLLGYKFGIPGWASTFSIISFGLGLGLVCFSIIFEFLSRILVLLMEKQN